jgi:hypothetical protein
MLVWFYEYKSGLMKENKNMFYGALPILFEFAKELRNNQTQAEICLE